jgi:flagellin
MSLSINNNSLSLNAQRSLHLHVAAQETLLTRLTAGTRINKAADDPAGQAIAARMDSSMRGLSQAMRAISDGGSMLQVADGALANVADSLQRLRELAVASGNGSYGSGDRVKLQQEAMEILNHINQVGAETQFNGEALFSHDRVSIGGEDEQKRAVLDGLKTGWLSASEKMIKDLFGLEADGVKLKVNLVSPGTPSGVLAWVAGSGSGKLDDLSLNIDMADFGSAATADGGSAPMYSDRIIAHEMAHAIMARTMNYANLPSWFREGAAELIHGADERVRSALAGADAATIVGGIGVSGGTYEYESAYVAARFLHQRLKDLGVEGGMKGLMQHLSRNQGATLSTALDAVTGGRIASEADFLVEFGADGDEFLLNKMNLANRDTGAIGGLDADGGPEFDARSVVADAGDNNADDGLGGFVVEYPELGGHTGVRRVQVQAGDKAGDLIELQFGAINAAALGLAKLDMQRGAVALLHVDQALAYVNQQRVVAGASSNRLDLAAGALQAGSANMAAARERIAGVDYAGAAAGLTRAQILQQAASAMLAQANSQPRAVLSLLR